MYSYSRPIPGLSAIRSERFVALLRDYEGELVHAGYSPYVTRLHLHSVAHFGIWLDRRGFEIEKIDEGIEAAFARHRTRCRCPSGASHNHARQVVSRVRVFVRHLRERGCIAAAEAPPQPPPLARAMQSSA